MGSSEHCCDGKHGACATSWCDCGCHEVVLFARARIDEAMRGVAFGPIVSTFDHDRDGPKISDALRAQPEVAAAEYDPASRSVNVTLTGEALGLMPIMVEAIGSPVEVVGVRTEYEQSTGARAESFPVTVRGVLRR